MNKGATIFLQFVIVLIGIGALAWLLWEPQLEGVNAHATNFEIYSDPFILLAYAGSIPLFIALYLAFQLLGSVRQDRVFSQESVRALRSIRFCAFAIIGFVIVEEVFIMLNHGDDDAAGAIMMGVLITFGSIVVAAVAGIFEGLLRRVVVSASLQEQAHPPLVPPQSRGDNQGDRIPSPAFPLTLRGRGRERTLTRARSAGR